MDYDEAGPAAENAYDESSYEGGLNRKKAPKSIRFRMFSAIVVIMLISLIVLGIYERRIVNEYVDDYYSAIGSVTAGIVAAAAEDYDTDYSEFVNGAFIKHLQEHCEYNNIYGIFIEISDPPFDMTKVLLYVNANYVNVTIKEALSGAPGFLFPSSEEERQIFTGERDFASSVFASDGNAFLTYMYAIKDRDGKCVAVAGVDFHDQERLRMAREKADNIGKMILITMALILAVMLLLLNKIVVEPVQIISAHMRNFVKGDKINPKKITMKYKDEFGQMAEDFNTMTDDVSAYVKARESMNGAAHIQAGMLPAEGFENDYLYIDAFMKPARYVGGDFYDYFYMDDGRTCVVIADVSGKGLKAALFMAAAVNAIRYNARLYDTAAKILAAANNDLAKRNSEQLFVTAFVAIFDPRTAKLSYTNAGHNRPYLVRAREVAELDGAAGLLLGLFEDEEYETEEIRILPGDLLFMYTDGLSEAVSPRRVFFGKERIERLLEKISGFNVTQKVMNALKGFVRDAEQHDDITMLAVIFKKKWDITMSAQLSEIPRLKRFIIDNVFIPERYRKKIYLAAEEIFVNICRYAYNGEEGDAQVRITVGETEVEVMFIDSGVPYNPLEDVTAMDEYDVDTQIGGLGKILAFTIADSADYEYKSGKNMLTIRKKISVEDHLEEEE